MLSLDTSAILGLKVGCNVDCVLRTLGIGVEALDVGDGTVGEVVVFGKELALVLSKE